MPNIDQIKDLREQTGVSVSECKKALEETKGDIEKAKEILRKWGKSLADKKSSRKADMGIIETYIHPNKKIGVIIDIRCESDFVAKSKEFQEMAHEICLQIAATNPSFLSENEISEELINKEKEIYKEQLKDSEKPKDVLNQIIEGKIKKYKSEISLMSQTWIKDGEKKMIDFINENIAKIGENIIVKKFNRYEI